MYSHAQKISLFLARVIVGIYFVNFGLAAFWTPGWSLLSFIGHAQLFPTFYHAIAVSSVLPVIATVLKFAFLVIGALLILGIFVRLSAFVGILLMLFFYFPLLVFPYVCGTSAVGVTCGGLMPYIVNSYLLIAGALLMLITFRAGETWGLGSFFRFSQY